MTRAAFRPWRWWWCASKPRAQNQPIATHVITVGELAFFRGALKAADGFRIGDCIEHGGEIPMRFLPVIAEAGLTVASQLHFIRSRGDHYLAETCPDTHNNLYGLASLKMHGISLAAGSDTPRGSFDPWAAMAAAIDRKTSSGRVISAKEKLAPCAALDLFLGHPETPETPRNTFPVGVSADFCRLNRNFDEWLEQPEVSVVVATFIAGELVS